MMFCGKCGAQMKDGDKFCPDCGNLVNPVESASPVKLANLLNLLNHITGSETGEQKDSSAKAKDKIPWYDIVNTIVTPGIIIALLFNWNIIKTVLVVAAILGGLLFLGHKFGADDEEKNPDKEPEEEKERKSKSKIGSIVVAVVSLLILICIGWSDWSYYRDGREIRTVKNGVLRDYDYGITIGKALHNWFDGTEEWME